MNVPEVVAVIAVVGIIGQTLTSVARTLVGGRDARRGRAEAGDADARLERIEQAVDAMAVEVERISEGQRFTTRLLAERNDGVERAGARYEQQAAARNIRGGGL